MRILILIIAILAYQTVFSQDQMFDICPLKVGEEIPDATLINQSNEQVSLLDLTMEKPTVIVFYRGAWCGYCTKHLAELNDLKEEIESLGYQMIGITPDQSSKLAETQTRAESEIPVYSDSNMETIQGFGLDWKVGKELFEKYKTKYKLDLEEWSGTDHHSLPVPSIYIVENQTVQFQYVNPNFKIRLKPETLLAVLKTL